MGAGAFTFAISFAGWMLLKAVLGIRVSPEEEFEGLDIGEHGITAYPDFQLAHAYAGQMPAPGAAGLPLAERMGSEARPASGTSALRPSVPADEERRSGR